MISSSTTRMATPLAPAVPSPGRPRGRRLDRDPSRRRAHRPGPRASRARSSPTTTRLRQCEGCVPLWPCAVPYSGQLNTRRHLDSRRALARGTLSMATWTQRTRFAVNSTQTVNTDPGRRRSPDQCARRRQVRPDDAASAIELQVGRAIREHARPEPLDGPATFPSETELLRQYLQETTSTASDRERPAPAIVATLRRPQRRGLRRERYRNFCAPRRSDKITNSQHAV